MTEAVATEGEGVSVSVIVGSGVPAVLTNFELVMVGLVGAERGVVSKVDVVSKVGTLDISVVVV